MEKTYYNINETAARTANDLMSFSSYKNGSKTEEYREYVDQAYELADRVAKAKPDQADRVYKMAARYSKNMAEYINRDIHIGCMCPSVMISGAGNFPVRKKARQNQARDRNYQFFNQTQSILNKMGNILYGNEQIKSSDDNAIEKLEEKLADLKDKQAQMKAVNKAIRLKETKKGDELLKSMGYSDEQIKQLREPDFCGRTGYPDFKLRNNNSNIHRIERRIKNLREAKNRGILKTENQFFKVIENTDIMRLQLFFDGKPEPEVREVLKSNSFRWSPKNMCWQRQLTKNAQYALERVIKELEVMKTKA